VRRDQLPLSVAPTLRENDAMTRNWTPLAVVYLVLAAFGLAGTWAFNALSIVQLRDFVGDWVGSGPAVSSLTIDLMVTAVAGSILIVVESRRLGMRLGWLYVILAVITAFAFTFPLFLSARERRLTALRREGTPDVAATRSVGP